MASWPGLVNLSRDTYGGAMAVRPVVIWPDERLRQPSVPITSIDASVRALYQDLVDSMYAENGLGIAALQLGDPRRMFIVEPRLAGRPETDLPVAFINPEVIDTSDELQDSEEGCLSFPDIYIKVKRPMRCKLRATGLDGNVFRSEEHTSELQSRGLISYAVFCLK